jgi:preprotein translocase subunit SecE
VAVGSLKTALGSGRGTVMAVAEARKMDKTEISDGKGGWLADAGSWLPNKFNQTKNFLTEVRAELKKVTWPAKDEVYQTTIIVVATTVFFGFFLWLLDLLFSQAATRILR